MKTSFVAVAALVALWFGGDVSAATLDSVKLRGTVVCGVSTASSGFSTQAGDGRWVGMDVDLCRAVAAAVLGDAKKVQYVSLTAKERFPALTKGEVDILSRNTTWTYTRDTSQGLTFVGVNYYDGQGFMVRKGRDAKILEDLNGSKICFETGTTTELNLADAFATKGLSYKAVPMDAVELTTTGFQSGRCDVMTSDISKLYGQRLELPKPDLAEIMPLVISKEPLGPAVRQGDTQWASIVRWTLFAQINAEELGVSSANLDQMRTSKNPNVQLLLKGAGTDPGPLGLPAGWPAAVIKQVGNYGEIFDRNVGANSPLKIERGLNRLWNQGGILYAPPFR